jgi:hygromycin-B 7''-O-kinase
VTVLPPAATEDAFTTACQDEAALRPGVERLGRRLRIDVPGLTRFAVGSRPVYASGNLVLKLFPPVDLTGCRVEAGVLAAVQGKLPTPTPRVLATGEHDGWGYLLMSRLSGVALDTVWDRVPTRERDGLAGQLGETVAALHQLPLPDIPAWWPADWPAFVAQQRAECVSEQRSYGLPEAWRLSGLIDFEPAMRGEREYDFVAVGVFVAKGDARFLTRTLTAYGYDRDQFGPELRRRLLAWGTLHRKRP